MEPSRTESIQTLYSREFCALVFVLFFGFCNMSVFYGFYTYLERIGIDIHWRGLIVGLEPMAAFLLRPVAAYFLHAGNALKVMGFSLFSLMGILCAYSLVNSLYGLILLRILHGVAFVWMVSANVSLTIRFIPKEKSTQAFGLISLASLIPYAVIPFVTETLLHRYPDEAVIYAGMSVLGIPGVILLGWISPRIRTAVHETEPSLSRRPNREDLLANIRTCPIWIVLGIQLLIFFTYASTFYFMKPFLVHQGIGNDVGLFFSLFTGIMIVIRLFFGSFLNHVNKPAVLSGTALFLAVVYFLFGRIQGVGTLIVAATAYGFCMGVSLPLVNALIFDISAPALRGFNSNMGLFMMDAGFFSSPYLAAFLLSSPDHFSRLFFLCAWLAVGVAFLAAWLGRKTMEPAALRISGGDP